jgi:hypothetical protein
MSAFAGAGRSAAQVDEASLAGAGDTRYVLLKPNTLGIKQIPVTWLDQASIRALLGIEKKNYIINGAMMVSQEVLSTAVQHAPGEYKYDIDCWALHNGTSAGVVTVQQVASLTPGGSPNRLRVTVTTADTAIAAGEFAHIVHLIEGYRVCDLKFGTAGAKDYVLQLGVKGPAGTYTVRSVNSANNRVFLREFTIQPGEANTDVVKTILVPGDTGGVWLKDSGIGLGITVSLAAGTTYQSTAGSWLSSPAFATANQFNFFGTVGNVFELFDVGLYEGVDAPPFIVPDYDDCLRDCQRFWETVGLTVSTSSPPYHNTAWFKVTKRISPALAVIAGDPQGSTIGLISNSPTGGVRQLAPASTPADIAVSANSRL